MSEAEEAAPQAVYDEWGRDPRAPLPVRIAGAALAGILRLMWLTARVVASRPERHARLRNEPGGSSILVFWHCQIGIPFKFFQDWKPPRACLMSRSRDGEMLAQTVAWLQTRSVRGSSSSPDGTDKGGGGALRALARAAKAGFHPVITPDGPKGPPEQVQPGVIALAALTGLPILPLGFAAKGVYRLKSWDRTVIPLPFCRLAFSCGEPIRVPRTADSAVIESHRAELERRLHEVNAEARDLLGPARK
ncbi:MAG: lysophospholipid acyltransferase family protein [bacterium]